MNPHARPRPRRRPAVLGLAGLATLAAAPVALADNPITVMPAQFTQAQTSGGGFTADGEPSFAAVRSAAEAAVPDWALERYCNPYGPGTAIVGFQFLMGRWHTSRGDAVRIYEETDNGTHSWHSDSQLPQGVAAGYGPWEGAGATIAPTQCIHVKVQARVAVSGSLAYTLDLERVAIKDTTGPMVADLVVPGSWVTGPAVHVEWNQSDNGFGRGTTWADIPGSASVSALGDPADGRVGADLPLTAIPDGIQTVQVHRSAGGWTTATAEAPVRIDRTPPPVPSLRVDTDAWTNAASVGVSASGTDAMSGLRALEFQLDGGTWTERASDWSVSSTGSHTVRVRAVDNAGLVSPSSETRTIHIDRTAPAVTMLDVDASGGGDPTVRFGASDAGGSGLGDCRATLTLVTPTGQSVPVAGVAGRSLAGQAEVTLPMQSQPAGTYNTRLDVCDEAGNHAARTVAFTWQRRPTPTEQAAAPPGAAPAAAAATTSGSGPGIATPIAAGRLELIRPVILIPRVGRIVLSGRLMRDGRPIPVGARAVLRDSHGVVVSRGRVRRNGLVVLRGRLTSAGWWRLTVLGTFPVTLRFRVVGAPGAGR